MAEFASLDGKLALVTGASRGIGRAIAEELARAGASVVVGYRSGKDEAEQLATAIGGRAIQADVSNADEARRLVAEAGDIDVLVNNAGLTRDGLLARMSDDDWTSLPRGLTMPSPVITTRRLSPIYIPNPPSTSSTSPVMNEASAEARKRTAPAISSGSATRPSGVCCTIAAVASSGSTSVSAVLT